MRRFADRLLLASGGICLVVSAVLAFTVPHALGPLVAHAWMWGALVPGYLVGALAVIVRPDHLSARWLGRAGSLLAIETVARRAIQLVGDAEVAWWVAGSVVLQLATLATTAAIASVLVVFPDDSLRYRYQRLVVRWMWITVVAAPTVLILSEPRLYFPFSWFDPAVANPLHVSWLASLQGIGAVVLNWRAALWVAGAVAMVIRYRRATPALRHRFVWPLATGMLLTTFDIGARLWGLRPPMAFGGWVPGYALLSLSILVAILRYRLIGVDLWLRRSILFGGVSAIIALAYWGLAAVLGLAVGERASLGVGVLTTLVAVVAFQPARKRLDNLARHWVFGSSVAGSELLRRAGETLEDAYNVAQLSANIADTIVAGLQLDWARVLLSADGDGSTVPVAAVGVALDGTGAPDLVVPLTYADESLGCIECGPKRRGELSRADEELLATVGRQAALAVRNARLTIELESRLEELRRQADELAASRSRIVQAQVNERRRIERNIHDGVQQDIVAAMASLRLARNQLGRHPELASATLENLQEHTRRTLENIRELSRGIHPPVLTHRGLLEALDALADRMPIDLHLDVTPDVCSTRYAEDVEVVAYFVVSEGLANVLKHASVKQATVTLDNRDEWLTVDIIDHGRGCDPDTAEGGSGILGLRDRVESIGGRLSLDSSPSRGTILRAQLPARRGAVSHA